MKTLRSTLSALRRMVGRFRRLACRHGVYYQDMHRVSASLVVAKCARCGKELRAFCGLMLPCEWLGDRPETPNSNPSDDAT